MTSINTAYDESRYIYKCKPVYEFFKSVFDISFAIALLLIFVPFLMLITILIKLSDRGPAFYAQERVGRNGKVFNLLKFRTMRVDSEIEPVWAVQDDPRCTKIGRLLRRASIDELPQLINIIKLEMSFVGPRPERPFFMKDHPGLTGLRLSVKPGLTGLAQVNGRYNLSINEKLHYDLEYVHNRRFYLDFIIIVKTVYKVFICEGAW